MFGPWLFGVRAAAAQLLRRAPRPAQRLPVTDWARAYGLIPTPGPRTSVSLLGHGPGFDREYAMTTDLAEPVIIATVPVPAGGPPASLLIDDGTHRLYKAVVQGRTRLPSLVLTQAETLTIRRRPHPGPASTPAAPSLGGLAMTSATVSIWHNVARDQAGRHTAPLDGFTPGDPMVRVFSYQATVDGRSPEAIAEEAFALANGHPRGAGAARLSRLITSGG
jgi:hypothetical protein